jgi:hypothetical protein
MRNKASGGLASGLSLETCQRFENYELAYQKFATPQNLEQEEWD